MATRLYRLGRWCAAHGWRVIGAWAALLALLGVLAATISTPTTSVVQIPDAEFMEVMDHLEEQVPGVSGTMGTAVFTTADGSAITPQQRTAVAEVIEEWEGLDHVTTVVDPFEAQARAEQGRRQFEAGEQEFLEGERELQAGIEEFQHGRGLFQLGEQALAEAERTAPDSPETARLRAQVRQGRAELEAAREQLREGHAEIYRNRAELEEGRDVLEAASGVRFVSKDGSAALAQIGFDIDPQSLEQQDRDRVIEAAAGLEDVGVEAYFGSELTLETSVVGAGEVIGLVTAAIVLLVMLGSVVAAGLPLLVALFGVGVALVAAVAATAFFEMHTMTPALALMLGLAVGIDYSLFIINRHRTQLLGGMSVVESAGRAVGTAGNAVVFAGSTVVVALVALVLSGIPILGQMGLVAAGAVVAAVAMAITLSPALLGLLGRRIVSRRAWRRAAAAPAARGEEEHGGWYVRLVTARPWLTVAAVVGLLLVMTWPLTQLRLGLPDGSSEELGSSAQQAYTTVADKFGPGMNGPLVVVADLPDSASADEAQDTSAVVTRKLMRFEGVDAVVPIGQSEDRSTLAWQVVLESGPTEEATVDTVHAMLEGMDTVEMSSGTEIGITGSTVANIEISERLSGALVPYLTVVVGLSLLILMAVFRSVVVPLIATGGFLLSVGAAFGALVAVFQWGWLGDFFGVHTPGPLMSFGPILLIGVLFGLAMDYQMFLVSGMREAWAHGQDARGAVKSGFTHGVKVVTAAAAIMVAVFGGFVFSHMVMIRPIGFGLAVGVLVDAVLVRMTLTPAVMHLLGDRAWQLPAWLDRLLPDLDVEGAKLAAASPAAGGTDGAEAVDDRTLTRTGR